MSAIGYLKLAGIAAICNLAIGSIVFAENRVLESTFCLKMDGLNCSVPLTSERLDLSQIVSIENGIRRLYFWSKIEVNEDQNIVHVWVKKRGGDRLAKQVHVFKSRNLQDLSPETVNVAYENLKIKYNTAEPPNSIQGVILPVRRSAGFRTYSKIRITPGVYIAEICDIDGNTIAGGEAKTIRVSGLIKSTSRD